MVQSQTVHIADSGDSDGRALELLGGGGDVGGRERLDFRDERGGREVAAARDDARQIGHDAALADDLLHGAAFRSQSAGRPIVPHRGAGDVPLEALREFVAHNFTAPRLIVIASGLDADEAVAIAKTATSHVPKGTPAPAPTPYVGGSRFLELPSAATHFSLA